MSYYAKVNLLFGCLLTIITSIISYKSCAQGLRLPPNGCRLLDLEKEIDKFETKIDTVFFRIARNNQITDVSYFLAKERPTNIWVKCKIKKPSTLINRENCDQYADANWEEVLKDMHRMVEINLEHAQGMERASVANKQNATVLAPMQPRQKPYGDATPPSGKSEPEEIPILDLSKPAGNPAGTSPAPTVGNPVATTESPRAKPVVKKIDIEQLDRNFGYKSAFFKGKDYKCVVVNPRSESYGIDFLWRDWSGKVLGSFGRAQEYLKSQKKTPVMLMNAGIFDERRAPLGLFYSNAKKIRKLNTKKGEGNFFLEPTGVFIINKNGMARVITKEAYLDNLADTVNIRHATQSGPMLVIDGVIHPEFRENSLNQTIRNGVGILPDGRIVFIISTEPVNLYEFAQIFRDGLGCKNALYLDGAISKLYLPQLKLQSLGGDFAGMIAVYKTM